MPITAAVDDVQTLLALYDSAPRHLTKLVEDLSAEQLSRRPDAAWNSGAWTVNEVVQHLADADTVFDHRLRRALAEENPTFAAWDENRFADALAYNDADAIAAVAIIDQIHRRSLPLLQSLTPEQCQRTATHPERGRQTVQTILHYAAHHLRHHAEFIAAKLRHL